jgi:hypothetical protein
MVLALHAALAILLFFLINWLGHSAAWFGYQELTAFAHNDDDAPAFNVVLRIAAPIVFVILIAAAFYGIGKDHWVHNIYDVVILYFVVRFAFNLIRGRRLLVRWMYHLAIATTSSIATYALYVNIINKKQYLLPTWPDMSSNLWLIVVVFVYHLLNRTQVPASSRAPAIHRYLDAQFASAQRNYHNIIETRVPERRMQALVYAILIYESLNRPPIYRWIERHILFPLHRAKTTGVMQVTSTRPLGDRESVELGVALLMQNRPQAEARARRYASTRLMFADSEGPEVRATEVESYVAARWYREVVLIYNPDSAYAESVLEVQSYILAKHLKDQEPTRAARGESQAT